MSVELPDDHIVEEHDCFDEDALINSEVIRQVLILHGLNGTANGAPNHMPS